MALKNVKIVDKELTDFTNISSPHWKELLKPVIELLEEEQVTASPRS